MGAAREDILAEEVRQLREALGVSVSAETVGRLQLGLRLTHHQALLLAALYRAGSSWMSVERLNLALPDGGADGPRDPRTVKVQICNIRKRLGEESVLCLLGVGYTLGAPGVMACRRVLDPGVGSGGLA